MSSHWLYKFIPLQYKTRKEWEYARGKDLRRNKQPDPREMKTLFVDGWKTMPEADGNASIEHNLSSADPRLGLLISRVMSLGGPRRIQPSNAVSHYDAISRSIIYQQISKQAAASIYSRYVEIFGGPPSPESVLEVKFESLRKAGLSTPKIKYLKAIASAIVNGELIMDSIDGQPDELIIRQLTKIPGIGKWTAQMFLMFRLRRPDVLPIEDLGVRRGLQLAYGLQRLAAPNYVERVGRRWAPYRSIACLYLWAAVDTGFVASE